MSKIKNMLQNNSMYSTIIFLSISIIIASIMMTVEIEIMCNFALGEIEVVIAFFGLKILKINFDIMKLNYSINRSKKRKRIKLYISEQDKYLLAQIKSSIIDKFYYDKFSILGEIGFDNQAHTAILVGTLNQICANIESVLIVRKSDCDFDYYIFADMISRKNNFNFKLKIFFTIFDMVFAVIISFYKRGRYVKERRVKK